MVAPNPNINQTNQELRDSALETASIVAEALRSITAEIAATFATVLNDTDTVVKSLAKDLQKNFNTLSKTSKDTATNIYLQTQGLAKEKSILEQINKRKAEELAAGINLVSVLKAQGASLETIDQLVDKTTGDVQLQSAEYRNLTDIQRTLVGQYAEALRYSQEQLEVEKELAKQAKKQEEDREDSLGLSGKTLKTIGNIKGLGDASAKSQEKLNEYANEYYRVNGKFPGQWQTLGKAIALTSRSLVKGLRDPLAIVGLLIKGFLKYDQAVVGVQKSLAISRDQAGGLVKEFTTFNGFQQSSLLSSADLLKSIGAIQSKLGSVGKVSKDTAETFARLNTFVGLSEEGAAGLVTQADAFGKNASEVYKTSVGTTAEIGRQYKTNINQKAVLESVGKASAYTLIQFKGSTQALTEGVAKANALGISLETVNKSAQGLLNFQQSIEDELAAEVLSGKQLNLEQARYYALTNQQSKLMDELNGQVGTYSDFTKQTVLAQEAQAKALGMSLPELSDMLFKQEYMKNTAQEQAMTEEEIIQSRIESLTVQEKLQKAVEKLSETFANFVAGPLGTFLTDITVISGILGFMAGSQLGKLAAAFAPVIARAAVFFGLQTGTAAAATATATAISGGSLLPVILGGIGAVLAMLAATNVDDMYSGGDGYGERTLMVKGKGAFRLNNEDRFFATTDKNFPYSANQAGGGQSTVNNQVSVAPSNTSINLNLNGAAIGNATARQDYAVGKNIRAFGGSIDYSAPV
jgi:hypothetical protein